MSPAAPPRLTSRPPSAQHPGGRGGRGPNTGSTTTSAVPAERVRRAGGQRVDVVGVADDRVGARRQRPLAGVLATGRPPRPGRRRARPRHADGRPGRRRPRRRARAPAPPAAAGPARSAPSRRPRRTARAPPPRRRARRPSSGTTSCVGDRAALGHAAVAAAPCRRSSRTKTRVPGGQPGGPLHDARRPARPARRAAGGAAEVGGAGRAEQVEAARPAPRSPGRRCVPGLVRRIGVLAVRRGPPRPRTGPPRARRRPSVGGRVDVDARCGRRPGRRPCRSGGGAPRRAGRAGRRRGPAARSRAAARPAGRGRPAPRRRRRRR